MISTDYIKERLNYDAGLGQFTWRVNNRRPDLIGKVAGNRNAAGYWSIAIDNKKYLAHRLAWAHVTGAWPKAHIDHIDGDKLNNKFYNLRDVSRCVNLQNMRKPTKANKSGFLGVCAHQGKWLVQIMAYGVRYRKSGFNTPEEAHSHYVEMKRKLHKASTL
jgi:hypothetical protein